MAVPNPWPAFWAAKKMNEERQKYDAYDRYELDEAPVPQALYAASLILLVSAYIGGMGYVLYKCFAPEKTDKAEKTEQVTPTSPLGWQFEFQMEWAVKSPNSFYEYIDRNPDENIRKITKLREHGSYGSPGHFWGVNRQGTVVQGHISLQPDVIFPHDGDEIVVRYQKPHSPAEFVGVFDNITQRKRAAEYVKEKQR